MESVIYEIEDRVAYVTINRPEAYNACDQATYDRLAEVWEDFAHNDEAWVAILTGAGDKAFCAGGDLHSFAQHKQKVASHLKEVTTSLHGAISRLSRMNAPLIVAVNGVAAGAGFSFVGFADLVIASSNASFVSAYSKAGLTPDGSSTYFLPRIIGSRRYTELVLTNKILTADEACDWGLVNKVVDFNDLQNEAFKLAKSLAEGPTLAFGKLKNLVHNSFLDSLEGQMEYEARMISDSAKTKDGLNGIDAFVNKKKVSFKGE